MSSSLASSGWRSIHPGVVALLLLVHGVLAFFWEHPLLLIGQLLFLLGWARWEMALAPILPLFRVFLFLAPFFLVINSLFASNGVTFLWKGQIVPLLGRLDFTLEEVGYSCMGLIRLSILFVLSGMFQQFLDHDRFLFLFAKIAPRFVLTAVISIRMFPFLLTEFKRIKETAYLRGLRPQGKGKRATIRFYALLMRPLLFSALEGSWQTAETLYARGFGSGQRTLYKPRGITSQEILGTICVGIVFAFAIVGKVFSFGQIQYYPQFTVYDLPGDALFFACMLVVWLIPLYVLGRREPS